MDAAVYYSLPQVCMKSSWTPPSLSKLHIESMYSLHKVLVNSTCSPHRLNMDSMKYIDCM
jgi:hypothetical protein